jgi:galactokinase/mevalonate kinase-like predicted kinase
MENCAETMMRGFSDRQSVLVPSPYAYQKALSLVPANILRINQTDSIAQDRYAAALGGLDFLLSLKFNRER